MRIHCTMGELVAVREGRGSVAAREHVDGCQECMDELDRLHQRVAALKALPTLSPPRDRWHEVRGAMVSERRRRRALWLGVPSLAAATLAGLLFGVTQLPTLIGGGGPQVVAPEEVQVVQLMEESRQLERTLQQLQPDQRVMNGRLAGAVLQLEDGITAVDLRLNDLRRQPQVSREMVESLWRQRVQLQSALVRTHATRAAYVGF